jgi:signal transduction histidine kinase
VCLLLAFLGLRATDVVQLIVSMPVGLSRSTNATLDAAVALVYLVESIVITVAVLRARKYFSGLWAGVDTATGLLILSVQPFITTTADRVGSWTSWGFAVSVAMALGAGLGFPKRWQTLTAAALLAGVYLWVSLPGSGDNGVQATVFSNAVAYLGFALFPRALATYLRRLGSATDEARAAAVLAERDAERNRQRSLLHDHEAVLRLLAQPTLDPALAELLRAQAASGANRVRTFLTSPFRELDVGALAQGHLPEVVRAVAADFGDLPVELAVDLAEGAVLDPATAEAVADAVRTLLHNVRRHAQAGAVTIHADLVGERWELTVRDDGVGFDRATTRLGFGLRQLVTANLTAQGVEVALDSTPGVGTVAVLHGATDRGTT